MKYNIYKLHRDKYSQFLDEVVSRNYEKLKEKIVNGVKYEGYIYKNKSDEKIEWTKVILPFFENEPIQKNNLVSFIVIITKDIGKYVLTYGSAHFIVSNYLDEDFPYELISRIKIANIKNLAFNNHKKNNNRSIQTYTQNPHLIVDIGSSVAKISATPEDEYFGKRVEAAKSFKLNINGGLTKVSEYIDTFEKIIANESPIENIPTIKKVHDKEKIDDLYEKLAININDLMFDGGVEEFEIIGTYYNFNETYDKYILKFSDKQYNLPDMDFREILRILTENNYQIKSFDDLKQVKVKFLNDNNSSYLKSIHNYINYVVDNSYHLIEGNWYQFNNFYIEYLNDFFSNLSVNYDPAYDFDNNQFSLMKPQVQLKNTDEHRMLKKKNTLTKW